MTNITKPNSDISNQLTADQQQEQASAAFAHQALWTEINTSLSIEVALSGGVRPRVLFGRDQDDENWAYNAVALPLVSGASELAQAIVSMAGRFRPSPEAVAFSALKGSYGRPEGSEAELYICAVLPSGSVCVAKYSLWQGPEGLSLKGEPEFLQELPDVPEIEKLVQLSTAVMRSDLIVQIASPGPDLDMRAFEGLPLV